MDMADEQSYEEMINALQTYMKNAQEECTAMQCAAQDCVDNTQNDPAAAKSSERLSKCLTDIGSALEDIQQVIAAMQEELEDIRNAAARANAGD